MYFVTNKVVEEAGQSRKFKENSNELTNSLTYGKLTRGKYFEEVSSDPLMEALKTDDSFRDILFYIHGFNNQPFESVFPNAAILQEEITKYELPVVVVPIIWPCDTGGGIVEDYWDDQKAAKTSGEILSRAVYKLLKWQSENQDNPCRKRMHVLAHSMGNRVLMHALHDWRNNVASGEMPYLFDNIFMMAADVPNEALERGEKGQAVTMAARRVLCYYANDDLAMPASKVANVRNSVLSRRLGHTGPESMHKVPDHVYSVNCDRFNNKHDTKGHTYFLRDKKNRASPALYHIMEMIERRKIALPNRSFSL